MVIKLSVNLIETNQKAKRKNLLAVPGAVGLFLLLQLNSCFTSCFRSITIQLKQMEKRNRSFFTTQLGEDKKGKWWIVFFSFNYKRNERREKSAWIKWKEHTIHSLLFFSFFSLPFLLALCSIPFHFFSTEWNKGRRKKREKRGMNKLRKSYCAFCSIKIKARIHFISLPFILIRTKHKRFLLEKSSIISCVLGLFRLIWFFVPLSLNSCFHSIPL